jgi:uncharacterized membrane protein
MDALLHWKYLPAVAALVGALTTNDVITILPHTVGTVLLYIGGIFGLLIGAHGSVQATANTPK